MDLVVDLGQSGARIRIADAVTPVPIAKNSSETVLGTLAKVFEQIPRQSFDNVFLSLTGLFGVVEDPGPYGELCAKFFGAKNVCVMDDGIAAYVGALGERSGVALAIGGGVVAVSSHQGRFGHADGKGAIFGDYGSGFWVGQNAMRRAIATLDSRDDADDLVDALAPELRQYSELPDKTGVAAAGLCIAAAKSVAQAAFDGSMTAHQVLDEGARYLGRTIAGAWSKVSDGKATPAVALLGGLSGSPVYAGLIRAHTQKLVACEFVPAANDHLVGAPQAGRLYPNGAAPLLKWWRD